MLKLKRKILKNKNLNITIPSAINWPTLVVNWQTTEKKVDINSVFAFELTQQLAQKQAHAQTRENNFLKEQKVLIEKTFTHCINLRNNIKEGLVQINVYSLNCFLGSAKKQTINFLSSLNIAFCAARNGMNYQPLADAQFENFTNAIRLANDLKKIIINAVEQVKKLYMLCKLKKIRNASVKVNNILIQVQAHTNDVFDKLFPLIKYLSVKVHEYPLEVEKAETTSSELANLFEKKISMEEDVQSKLVDDFDKMFNIGSLPSIDEDE